MTDKTFAFTEEEHEFLLRVCKRAQRFSELNIALSYIQKEDSKAIDQLISKLENKVQMSDNDRYVAKSEDELKKLAKDHLAILKQKELLDFKCKNEESFICGYLAAHGAYGYFLSDSIEIDG